MASEQGLSAENLRIVGRERETYTMSAAELQRCMDAARSIPPVDEGVREKVARAETTAAEMLAEWLDMGTPATPEQMARRILALLESRP